MANPKELIMNAPYIEKHDDGYWIARSRVSLDSIVYAFLNGDSAESIFPALTLEQVYGAIAFYLANRDEIDTHLKTAQLDFAAKRQAAREADPMFYQKLAEAKRQLKKVEAFLKSSFRPMRISTNHPECNDSQRTAYR